MRNSNFAFLSEHWAFLLDDAQKVESYALNDPRTSAIYARRTVERALTWLFENDSGLRTTRELTLATMVYDRSLANATKLALLADSLTPSQYVD